MVILDFDRSAKPSVLPIRIRQGLLLSSRSMADICASVVYLCSRDIEAWSNVYRLTSVITFLQFRQVYLTNLYLSKLQNSHRLPHLCLFRQTKTTDRLGQTHPGWVQAQPAAPRIVRWAYCKCVSGNCRLWRPALPTGLDMGAAIGYNANRIMSLHLTACFCILHLCPLKTVHA